MRQALHIFKKDVRYLRWELVLVLVFLGVFVYRQARPEESETGSPGEIEGILLGCVWAFVCARLIQAEAITGDRQFWLTRPYSWRSLLAAKLLFVLVFLSVPLILADAAILAWVGLSIAANAAGLLCWAVLVTVAWLLPLCAFATLMRGLAQWILVLLLAVCGFLGLGEISKGNVWGSVEWIRNLGGAVMLFIVASAVLLLQYKSRRTVVSRVAMAGGLLAIWVSWDNTSPIAAFELQTRLSKPRVDPSAILLELPPKPLPPDLAQALGSRWPLSTTYPVTLPRDPDPDELSMKYLAIPLDISGLGNGLDLITDAVRVSFEIEGGDGADAKEGSNTWESAGNVLDKLQTDHDGLFQTLQLHLDGAFFKKASYRLVHVRLTLYLTVLGNAVSKVMEPGPQFVSIPGGGACSMNEKDGFNTIRCVSPLREPSQTIAVRFGRQRQDWYLAESSYSPLSADLSISPLHWYWRSVAAEREYADGNSRHPTARANVTMLEPLAHFTRDLEFRHIYLNDYAIRTPNF